MYWWNELYQTIYNIHLHKIQKKIKLFEKPRSPEHSLHNPSSLSSKINNTILLFSPSPGPGPQQSKKQQQPLYHWLHLTTKIQQSAILPPPPPLLRYHQKKNQYIFSLFLALWRFFSKKDDDDDDDQACMHITPTETPSPSVQFSGGGAVV